MKMSENRAKCCNIVKAAASVILAAVMGMTLFLHFTFSEREAAPKFFGVTVFQVHTHAMEPAIPDRTAIFLKKPESSTLKKGSVVLCSIGGHNVLMRICGISEKEDSISYLVKFDTSSDGSEYTVSYDDIIGRASVQSRFLGSVLYFISAVRGVVITAAICGLLLFAVFVKCT